MGTIPTCKDTLPGKLGRLIAGDRLVLEPGDYRDPVVFSGIRGTRKKPVIIESKLPAVQDWARFSSQVTSGEYRILANEIAAKRQSAGYFPSVGQTADEAMLTLHNCQYVVIRNLGFDGCWPGAIYLDQCQEIFIDNVDFREGTIAIGLNGHDTRNITIQNCHWQQEPEAGRMWHEIPWVRIHGASDNQKKSKVNIKKDSRHYDGDFVRTWDVAGNITIRNNRICDAFNGIHFFNSLDRLAPGVNPNAFKFNSGRRASANILIEGNHFERILDNCVEPESHAWNWVVRHNHMQDCYRPFSFELDRAGWIYVYGNTGAFLNNPSMRTKGSGVREDDMRRRMSLFKVKGKNRNEGEIYVFFNSWYYRDGKGLFPKGKIGRLVHCNNAAGFGNTEENANWTFGNNGLEPTEQPYDSGQEQEAEKKRFTRRWDEYPIIFDGDVIQDEAFPGTYRELGYKIGGHARGADPEFVSASKNSQSSPGDFKPRKKSPLLNSSIAMNIRLPANGLIKQEAGHHVGQFQETGVYEKIDGAFEFLYENDWIEEFPNTAEQLQDIKAAQGADQA